MKFLFSLLFAPILFLFVKYYDTTLNNVLFLKAFPLVISSFYTILMVMSYIKNESIIIYFAKKFTKKDISQKEQEYIHKSTLFWIFVSCVNIIIHSVIFFDNDDVIWVFYSSIGWYFLFAIAGICQFLHRKFVFLKG